MPKANRSSRGPEGSRFSAATASWFHANADSEVTKKFVTKFRETLKRSPSLPEAMLYDAAALMKQVVVKRFGG